MPFHIDLNGSVQVRELVSNETVSNFLIKNILFQFVLNIVKQLLPAIHSSFN